MTGAPAGPLAMSTSEWPPPAEAWMGLEIPEGVDAVLPHATIVPSALIAIECAAPAAIWTTLVSPFGTEVCPEELSPHAITVPFAVNAREWAPPAAIWVMRLELRPLDDDIPSTDPISPDPASVVTTPLDVIFRILWLL